MRLMVFIAVIAVSMLAGGETIPLSPIGGAAGPAQDSSAVSDVVKVRGKGIGTTRDEALKDAYRDAVERAVGLFVDAEQMVKNDELIKDEILTQSNAYIKKCDVVKEETVGGIIKIGILAQVVRRPLSKRIKDVMPPQTYNLEAGALNVHAAMVTEMKRNDDAAALVKKLLSDFNPITQLMKVGLVSPKPTVLPVKGDETRVNLAYLMKIELDERKYCEEFVPKFKQILDQVSLTKPKMIRMMDVTTKVSESVEEYYAELKKYKSHYSADHGISCLECSGCYDVLKLYSGNVHGKATGFYPASDVWRRYMSCEGVEFLELRPYDKYDQSSGRMEILLWTEPNSTGCRAYLYTVDEKVALVVEEWRKKIANLTTEYNIVFKDRSGAEIGAFSWMFQPDCYKENNCVLNNVSSVKNGLRMDDGSCRRFLVINHLIRGWAERYVEWRAFEFRSEDVSKISAVSIELAE